MDGNLGVGQVMGGGGGLRSPGHMGLLDSYGGAVEMWRGVAGVWIGEASASNGTGQGLYLTGSVHISRKVRIVSGELSISTFTYNKMDGLSTPYSSG